MPTHFTARRLQASAISLLLLSLCCAADAASATKNSTLTLSQTLARVLRDNPSLQSYPFSLRADEARTLQAQTRPNPELSLEFENVTGSGNLDGGEQLETTLALSQVIEMGNKREQRRQVSHWKTRQRQKDYELARIETLAQASRQFLRVARAQWQKQFIQQQSDWAKEADEAAERRFQAGSISAAEAGQAKAEAMRADIAVEQAQSQLRAEKIQLATYWGSAEVDFDQISADLFDLPNVPPLDQLNQTLEQSPQWQRWLTQRRLHQAQLELAQAQSHQNIEFGLGLKHQRANGDNGLNLSLSIPLAVNDRNQGAVSAARADLDVIDSQQRSETLALKAQIQIIWQRLHSAKRRVSALRERVLPQLQRVEAQYRKGYQRGRFSYIDLLNAHQQRLNTERTVLNAAFEFHQTLTQLEQLTGVALTQRHPQAPLERAP